MLTTDGQINRDHGLGNNNTRFAHDKAFIQQTAAPNRYNTRPPSTNHPSSVYKRVDADATFVTPILDPNATNVVAKPGTGLLLWFPQRGTDSVYHMGIVPQGTTSTRIQNTAGYPNPPTFFDNSLTNCGQVVSGQDNGDPPQILITGVSGFVFTRALALPRLDVPIKIAPILDEQFSLSRLYGGVFRLYSDTIATGSTALNGTASCSVISDTRDVAQNAAGTDAFPVVDLAQSARTVKEIVKDTSIATGIVMIQGSDIAPHYTAPDSNNNILMQGGWNTPTIGPALTKRVDWKGIVDGNNLLFKQFGLFTGWYSPWGVNQLEGFGSTLWNPSTSVYAAANGIIPNDAIDLTPISEMGTVDIKVQFGIKIHAVTQNGTANKFENKINFVVIVEHYFAGIISSLAAGSNPQIGQVNVRCLRTVHTLAGRVGDFETISGSKSQLQAQSPAMMNITSSITDQYVRAGSLAGFGKFIGAKVYIGCYSYPQIGAPQELSFDITLFNYAPQEFTSDPIGDVTQLRDSYSGPVISFFARDINEPGNCGPCHVARYDGVGGGQQLRIEGVLNTESVAKGDLAPYVQDQVMNSRLAPDINVLPLIWMLYNGISPFKMSWAGPEYDSFLETIVYPMTAESLLSVADGDPRIKTSMDAAGLFSSILGGIGGTLGGLADGILGASGQFGARGQFGAAGQFGATGQFGDMAARGQFGASGQYGDMLGRRQRTAL